MNKLRRILNILLNRDEPSGPIHGNGNIVSEARLDAAQFNGVDVAGACDVSFQRADTHAVRVTTDSNILPYIHTSLHRGVVHIRLETPAGIQITPSKRIQIEMQGPTLELLQASGSVDFEAHDLAQVLLVVNASGSTDLTLAGEATCLDLDASGSVDMKAKALRTQSAKLDLSGSVDAEINVNDSLEVEASGSVDLKVHGNPQKRRIDKAGAVTVKFRALGLAP